MTSLCLRSSTESFATATHVSEKMICHPQTGDLFSVPELFIMVHLLTRGAKEKDRMVLYRRAMGVWDLCLRPGRLINSLRNLQH